MPSENIHIQAYVPGLLSRIRQLETVNEKLVVALDLYRAVAADAAKALRGYRATLERCANELDDPFGERWGDRPEEDRDILRNLHIAVVATLTNCANLKGATKDGAQHQDDLTPRADREGHEPGDEGRGDFAADGEAHRGDGAADLSAPG